MKSLFIFLLCASAFGVSAQNKEAKPDKNKKIHIVEASCGQCKFGLTGQDCDLAICINDTAYYVDGTKIDDHGDAHAKDGFCNAIRKAMVQGDVVDGRFKATYFKLLPEEKKKKLN